MISPEHRAAMVRRHSERQMYAARGRKWHHGVRALADYVGARDILDYGAGKQTLARHLQDLNVRCYEPAVPELAGPPEPADLVVCTQVLNDVEPERLEAVVSDLHQLAQKAIFIAQKRDAVKWIALVTGEGWRPWRLQYSALMAGRIEDYRGGEKLALALLC